MTASEYQAEAAQAAADTARYVAARDRHTHTGASLRLRPATPATPQTPYPPRMGNTGAKP